MGTKIVIYCRYSSEMQRKESCADQERDVRADLRAKGLDPSQAEVIYDEAESGTRSTRDGFTRLAQMIAAGEVAIVAVDDQSRLSRADNAFAFIQDLVFSGGRFISTGESIDTAEPGWELKVKVLELHHSQTVRDLQHRVRRGQLGRVLDDDSAGDFPYGYLSFYKDPDWQVQLARRGPKPKKGIMVNEEEARWVRQIFDWFVAGWSIGGIARELTRLGVSKGSRSSTAGWHPQQVRRILENPKYVGKWVWGQTTTRRNSTGRKKQVPVPVGQMVPRDRPHLRIVDQGVWAQARTRIAKLAEQFGYRPGQKRRGQKPPTGAANVYPRSLLGGVLVCGSCGEKLWHHDSVTRRYYSCPAHTKGLCQMSLQVPAEKAEVAVVEFLTNLLKDWPLWVRDVFHRTQKAVTEAAAQVPAARERDEKRLMVVQRQIDNLVAALADGTVTSAAVHERLAAAEREATDLSSRLAELEPLDGAATSLPDEAWVRGQLDSWVGGLTEKTSSARTLQKAVARIIAEPVLAPGKKRGFIRLRFRIRAWDVFLAAIGDRMPAALSPLVTMPDLGTESPEFQLDLGQPTAMDQWAPQIAVWRTEGVKWMEIVRRTGLDQNRAFVAWKRYVESSGGDSSRT